MARAGQATADHGHRSGAAGAAGERTSPLELRHWSTSLVGLLRQRRIGSITVAPLDTRLEEA
jgi:hypothetical protein